MVIGGFEAGLRDMCVGEIRHLMVPPKYAYGEWQLGSTVPARVTFHFTVELIDVTPDAMRRKTNLFKTIDVNDDGLIAPDEVLCLRYVLCCLQTFCPYICEQEGLGNGAYIH